MVRSFEWIEAVTATLFCISVLADLLAPLEVGITGKEVNPVKNKLQNF
jgi:hypothetical protein